MVRWFRRSLWGASVVAVSALLGCQQLTPPSPAPKGPPPEMAQAAPDAKAPSPEAAKGAAPADAKGPAASPPDAKAADAKAGEPKAPAVKGKVAEGQLLNPKDGVKVLLPEGWEQVKVDGGPLVQMLRREPVGGVRVNVSLDYTVDEAVPAGVKLATLEKEFTTRLRAALAERKFEIVETRKVTVAGAPALAVRGDLESDGQKMRLKQFLILQDKAYWTLSGIGPRDAFDKVVEPEIDGIAASLQLQ